MRLASLITVVAAFVLAPASLLAGQVGDTWLLHLPGIAGETRIDRSLIRGLRKGGYKGEVQVYDWTGLSPGLPALMHRKRNDAEAHKIADLITKHYRAHPGQRIVITSHSGGTALAVWALEDLPDDVKIDTLLLLASALSPQYDLSKALSHVRGTAYAFSSPNDILVLGAGTGLFGTMDGEKCAAAGKCGFTPPPSANVEEYRKLVERPYEKDWMKYGNDGDHIGVMRAPFVAAELTPLVTTPSPIPTTGPAQASALEPTQSRR